MKDIIIIGAGPAGLSAALYAKARGKDLLLLEKDRVGGLISHVSKVSHYASLADNESGEDFSQKLKDQLAFSKIDVTYEECLSIEKKNDFFLVKTNKNTYEGKKLIYAAGSHLKELDIDYKGFEIKHWPYGNEESLKGKTVIVNGGSDGASKEALYIGKFAKEVHIVQNQDALLCIDEFKKQIEASEKIKVHTSSSLKDIEVKDGKCVKAILDDCFIEDEEGIEIYVQIGQNGNTDLVKDLCQVKNTFLDEEISSKVDGLFFAGDVRIKDVKQIATAVADGTLAGIRASK